jgi:hypothetical protein
LLSCNIVAKEIEGVAWKKSLSLYCIEDSAATFTMRHGSLWKRSALGLSLFSDVQFDGFAYPFLTPLTQFCDESKCVFGRIFLLSPSPGFLPLDSQFLLIKSKGTLVYARNHTRHLW